MKKTLLVAAGALAAMSGAAQAHDWSGYYVGASIGTASSDVVWDDIDADWTGGIVHDAGEDAESYGLQAGRNWQSGNWVVGAQVDLTFADLTVTDYFNPYPSPPRINLEDDISYLASVRANAGYAFGAWLPYVTVGLAFSDLEHSWLEDGDVPDSWPGFENNRALVYGVGVNYALTSSWSVGAEALRYDFGKATEYNNAGAYRMQVDSEVDSVQLTVNYHLN